jgi:hypothetical protein
VPEVTNIVITHRFRCRPHEDTCVHYCSPSSTHLWLNGEMIDFLTISQSVVGEPGLYLCQFTIQLQPRLLCCFQWGTIPGLHRVLLPGISRYTTWMKWMCVLEHRCGVWWRTPQVIMLHQAGESDCRGSGYVPVTWGQAQEADKPQQKGS